MAVEFTFGDVNVINEGRGSGGRGRGAPQQSKPLASANFITDRIYKALEKVDKCLFLTCFRL